MIKSGDTAYVLYYDHDGTGDREEWNTFYTPTEIFADQASSQTRITALKKSDPSLTFHTVEIVVK